VTVRAVVPPDAAARAFWGNQIDSCGSNSACRTTKRKSVSAQFLLLKESVDSVGVIYRMHKAAFGGDPLYGAVTLSAQLRLARGVSAMTNTFVANPRFMAKYAALSNTAFVNTLVTNSTYAFSTSTT